MKIADISAYQEQIDWVEARKDLELIIFRASVGNKSDKKYAQYAQECQLPFGVYHYYKAGSIQEAIEETKFFYKCATVNNLNPLFFCLDIEYKTQTSKTTRIICETALRTLRELGVNKIGLYIGQERYSYLKDTVDNFDFIWIPRYGKNDGYARSQYKPVYPCDLWQYTSNGQVKGINGNVDLNVYNNDKGLSWFIGSPFEFKYLGSRVLKRTLNGEDVKELQEALKKLGFSCGNIDGIYGDKTRKAVRNFQNKYILQTDGICGKETVKKLLELLRN